MFHSCRIPATATWLFMGMQRKTRYKILRPEGWEDIFEQKGKECLTIPFLSTHSKLSITTTTNSAAALGNYFTRGFPSSGGKERGDGVAKLGIPCTACGQK